MWLEALVSTPDLYPGEDERVFVAGNPTTNEPLM